MPSCLLIEIIDDLVLEGDQIFTVAVVVGDNSALVPAPHNITIIDNDGKCCFEQSKGWMNDCCTIWYSVLPSIFMQTCCDASITNNIQ